MASSNRLGRHSDDLYILVEKASIQENLTIEDVFEITLVGEDKRESMCETSILGLLFDLDDGTPFNLEQAGRKFGMTRDRIRRIEGKAPRRIQHSRRSRQFRVYIFMAIDKPLLYI